MTQSNQTTCVVAGCFHGLAWHQQTPDGTITHCHFIGCECRKFSHTRETMPSDKADWIGRYNTLRGGEPGMSLITGSRGGGKTEAQRQAEWHATLHPSILIGSAINVIEEVVAAGTLEGKEAQIKEAIENLRQAYDKVVKL